MDLETHYKEIGSPKFIYRSNLDQILADLVKIDKLILKFT